METFRLVLAILLVILALLFLFLLWIWTGVEAVGVNGKVSVELRYGVLRVPVWPVEKKTKKPGNSQKATKQKKSKKQKKRYRYTLNREALDISGLLDFLLTILSELTDQVRISRARVRVLIGTDDAAKTGSLLGYASALTGIAIPFLENTFDMQDYHINIDADFDATHTEWAFTISCSLRPLRLLLIGLRHAGTVFRWYKTLIQKEEAIINE